MPKCCRTICARTAGLAVTVRADAKNAEISAAQVFVRTSQVAEHRATLNPGTRRCVFSAAFASSHSASISRASLCAASCRARRARVSIEREAALEFQVGRAQHAFRIGVEMAREVDDREQQVADFGRRIRLVAARSSAASISSASSRILASTARGSFQSKPTRAGLVLQLQRAG